MTDKGLPLAMRPDGPLGRSFGWVMERMNAPVYRQMLDALALEKAEAILEIGFGTGAFLELCARATRPRLLAGVDPARTMLEVAQERLRRFEPDTLIDLRLGTDNGLDWPEATFDSVIALHSFQFWEDPAQTLRTLGKRMAPGGRLGLCLRNHGDNPPDWLPNPLSRAPGETGATVELLQEVGFASIRARSLGSHSTLVLAERG